MCDSGFIKIQDAGTLTHAYVIPVFIFQVGPSFSFFGFDETDERVKSVFEKS